MRQNWTKHESNVILDCVKSYPSNLAFAFEQAATELPGRTTRAISVQYYKKLRNQATALSVMSSKGVATLGNQKNSRRDLKQELTGEQQRKLVLQFMAQKMSPKDIDLARTVFKKLDRENKQKMAEFILGL